MATRPPGRGPRLHQPILHGLPWRARQSCWKPCSTITPPCPSAIPKPNVGVAAFASGLRAPARGSTCTRSMCSRPRTRGIRTSARCSSSWHVTHALADLKSNETETEKTEIVLFAKPRINKRWSNNYYKLDGKVQGPEGRLPHSGMVGRLRERVVFADLLVAPVLPLAESWLFSRAPEAVRFAPLVCWDPLRWRICKRPHGGSNPDEEN